MLKHEVRTGDEPDAVKLALQAIRTLAQRLQGSDLTRMLSMVTSDCHEDLTSASHAEAAGKLLVVVMSAKSSTFQDLAPRIIRFLKRQLAGTSSALHLKNLLVTLNSILELRPSVLGPAGDQHGQLDESLARLFEETYDPLIQSRIRLDADSDDLAVVCKALRGLGLLATQPAANAGEGEFRKLLGDETCRQLCARLSRIITESHDEPKFDPVIQEVAAALSQIFPIYADGLRIFVDLAVESDSTRSSVSVLRRVVPILVSIGTRELPASGDQLDGFVYVVATLLRLLRTTPTDPKLTPEAAVELVIGILNAMMQFRSRFIPSTCQIALPKTAMKDYIVTKYPSLPRSEGSMPEAAPENQSDPQQTFEESFFAVCFFITKYLVSQETELCRDEATGQLCLPHRFGSRTTSMTKLDDMRLVTIGRMATFTFRHITPGCQIDLGLPSQIFCLFQPIHIRLGKYTADPISDIISVPLCSAWELITSSRVEGGDIAQLSLGIAEGIAPPGIQTLVCFHLFR